MSPVERIGIIFGSIVSFITILATVWYAAIAVNTLTFELSRANENIVKMEKAIISNSESYTLVKDSISVNTSELRNLSASTPRLVYINDNYVLMNTPEGKTFKVSLYKEDRDG